MALKYYFPTMPKTISLLAYLSEKQTKVSIYWKIKNKFCLIKTFFILTSNTLLLLLHHPLNPTSSPVRKKKIYKMWTTSSKIKNRRKCLQFFFCAFFLQISFFFFFVLMLFRFCTKQKKICFFNFYQNNFSSFLLFLHWFGHKNSISFCILEFNVNK